MKIIDAHVHVSPEIRPEDLAAFLTRTGTDGAVLQAVSHSRCLSLIPTALVMKHQFPDRFFVFGAPDRTLYYTAGEALGAEQAAWFARMRSCGVDGIKLLEGKPQMRKSLPIPDFDAPCWEAFWTMAEEEQIPILWHVNDPESFWSRDVSPWLVRQGWAYDDSFIDNEEQYRQVLCVLDRHPKLRVVFAHFFFLSAQLERLSAIFDRYPNVMVDLTPGIEMIENFSAAPDAARAFFAAYGDRICYGTDIGGRCILTNEGEPFNEAECLRRPEIVRAFLTGTEESRIESDGAYLIGREPFTMRPLGLCGERLDAILSGNIERQIGSAPLPVDPEAVLEDCAILREKMIDMTELLPDFSPSTAVVDLAERYFMKAVYEEYV